MRRLRALITGLLLLWTATAPTAHAQEDRSDWLDIELGKSIVLDYPKKATAIAITDPGIADVIPLASANKIQVQGKSVGTTDLVVQLGPGTEPQIYEITVHQDLSDLVRRVNDIVAADPPRVYPLKDRIVVQGPVGDLETLERVAQVARTYDEDFVNLMTVTGDHQVQLEVVFAEVSRTGLRELGINFLWGDNELGFGLLAPNFTTATAVAHPATVVNGGIVPAAAAGTFQMLGYIDAVDLGVVLSLLDDYRLTKILAQPTMACLSGQQAEFLAGGEVPLPAAGGTGAVTIQFKEYGVKLVFVPTVLANDVIDTRVYVEVSEPDFASGSRVTGIEVPGFISRKTQSHLRIESGMTFAMAGMIADGMSYSRAEVPLLGRIPLLGTLFRYTRHMRDERELVIFVTPRLARPLTAGEIPTLPTGSENNNPSDLELFFLGLSYRPGSRTEEPVDEVGLQR